MTQRQLEAFGEKFTSSAALSRFKNKDYTCPFDNRISKCDKPNRFEMKYGNCSACLGDKNRIICPRRFYESNYSILQDVKDFIWGKDVESCLYDEVKLHKKTDNEKFDYGNLDWVLTRKDSPETFIGVEIQSDATTGTGSFKTAIQDLMENKLKDKYTFGLNTLSSFKGFLPQFILKGQLFDEWKLPYVAIMQDELWEQFILKFKIQTHDITEYTTETFLFFIYSLVDNGDKYTIQKKKVVATRWVDLVFSFSVDNNLLINFRDAKNIIDKKIKAYDPVSTFLPSG